MPTFCAPWPGKSKTRPVSVHGGNLMEPALTDTMRDAADSDDHDGGVAVVA